MESAEVRKYSKDAEWVACNGQAHYSGVDQDHCMVCLPHWDMYPVCPECLIKLKKRQCSQCGQRYNTDNQPTTI